MSSDYVCPRCGQAISSAGQPCPSCRPAGRISLLRSDTFAIATLLLLAVGLFAITHFVTRSFERRQDHLARFWFSKGQGELSAGRAPDAIKSLRTALAYSRENFQYRLRLAQALAGTPANTTAAVTNPGSPKPGAGEDQQLRQAQAYLRALWEEQPGNGTVNLELARVAARTGDFNRALRFYHGAIFGVWEDDPEARRRQARLELAEYLLDVKAVEQAQSELIALAADLPRDPALHVHVARLFVEAGEYRRALEQYRAALQLDPREVTALVGAGEAAFHLERYRDAQRYLQRAVSQNPQNQRASELLSLVTLVRELDPFAPRLSAQERARRVLFAYERAGHRLAECAETRGESLAPSSAASADSAAASPAGLHAEYARLRELRPQMRSSALVRKPELADAAMDAVRDVEQHTAGLCGSPTGADQALLLITSRREREP